MIKIGSDFSGVGAFNQALIRLGIKYEEVFACDMDKYARKTFIHNYGEPKYYPENVYERKIPNEPLDIYMTSPPCQAFSLAGKRKGEDDDRGILFYNSHEFIQKNNPRYFIFENVKGLLSDDNGRTFQRWIDYLGGKSVNGTQIMFPDENAVPYHVYYAVLNAKDYGVPQNRERIFIIGIRDDADNNFTFPKPFPLTKRLKDVLEENVDEKYYLSEKMTEMITYNGKSNGIIADLNKGGQKGEVHSESSKYISCLTATDYKQPKQIAIPSATSKGYEIAKVGEDSINFEHPNSKTRRGRVGVGVGQTLTTSCNQGIATYDTPKVKFQLTGGKWDKTHEQSGRVYDENGISPTIHTMQGGNQEPKIAIAAIRGRNPDNPTSRQSGLPTQQMLEVNENGTSNALTTVQKDNVVVEIRTDEGIRFFKDECCGTIRTKDSGGDKHVIENNYRIRKLTPRECFRLMDFPDDFDFSVVSDSQAYKQAGNSIVVNVLAQIISKLNYK